MSQRTRHRRDMVRHPCYPASSVAIGAVALPHSVSWLLRGRCARNSQIQLQAGYGPLSFTWLTSLWSLTRMALGWYRVLIIGATSTRSLALPGS